MWKMLLDSYPGAAGLQAQVPLKPAAEAESVPKVEDASVSSLGSSDYHQGLRVDTTSAGVEALGGSVGEKETSNAFWEGL